MFEVNKIYNEDCLDTMARMPDGFVDLTVTSPPYDNLRDYKGYSFDFESVAKELYRVTKQGGVVVWVVGDATIKGSETGTSFRQALFFKECGFNLHDTMIYYKSWIPFPMHTRYQQMFEYMFVFSKSKPKTFNGIKIESNTKKIDNATGRNPDGTLSKFKYKTGIGSRYKDNVWKIKRDFKREIKHPAKFPEQLANDHIISWSNENDLVYDPFMGSGTTAKMAILNNRNYIGSEISKEYCEVAENRISNGGL